MSEFANPDIQQDLSPQKYAAGNPETLPPSEIIAEELVARVEQGLEERGTVPPRDERGWGWCNFVPDAVNYCIVQASQDKGYKGESNKYQLREVHFAAADLNREEGHQSREFADSVFGHGFNVVTIEDEPFLVDLSFSQFLGEDGYIRVEPLNRQTQEPNDNPLARQLVDRGFVRLTNETLREYLRITTFDPDPRYVDTVDISVFESVSPLPFDIDNNELIETIDGKVYGNLPTSYLPEGHIPRASERP